MSVHNKVKSYILSKSIGDNVARKIGVEVECFVFDKNYYRIPVNKGSIYSASDLLEELNSIEKISNASFSLEPGGQIEWASPACQTIQELDKSFLIYKKTLDKISFLKTASSVLAVFYKPNAVLNLDDFVMQKHIILLDSISDPGNMGAIIRTADWYGVKEIFVSKESVDVFNSKVIQSTMGSLSRVKIHVVDLTQLLFHIKKKQIPCFGATLLGDDVYDIHKPDCCALVFGSESHGISKEVKRLLDKEILIPSKNKLIDSLNVSVAFGIILSEFR